MTKQDGLAGLRQAGHQATILYHRQTDRQGREITGGEISTDRCLNTVLAAAASENSTNTIYISSGSIGFGKSQSQNCKSLMYKDLT